MARILTVKGFEASEAEVARRVINSNPRLLAAAHERFERDRRAVHRPAPGARGPALRPPARPAAADDHRRPARPGARRGARRPHRAAHPRRGVRRRPAHRPRPPVLTHSFPSSPISRRDHTMATLLYRLGKTAYRRWPFFLAGWLVAMLAVGTVAATMSKPMTDAFSIPGIPSEKAADLQAELFPGVPGRLRPGHRQRGRRRARGPHARGADVLQGRRRPHHRPRGRPAGARRRAAGQPGRRRARRSCRRWSTRPSRTARPPAHAEANAQALLAAVRGRPGRHDRPSTSTWRPPPTSKPASQDAARGRAGPGPRRRPDRRGQRLRHVRRMAPPGGASELIGIAARAARPDPHLRLAGRRRPADPHRDLRRRRSA